MEDIIYKSTDNSLEIRLKFIRKSKLKMYHVGKSWPIHTQCLLFVNGLLEHFSTIILHRYDEDDQIFAYKLVAEKCLKTIHNKWLRGQIRLELNKRLKRYESKNN